MANVHSDYIENVLLPEIVNNLNEKYISSKIEHSSGLDGFMSALYSVNLQTKSDNGLRDRQLMVKVMKGDTDFRESSKSYIQFANEIYIYAKVLPEFNKILKSVDINISVEDWVAHAYAAKFGFIEGLSSNTSANESVLVLENLKPEGYVLGPRVYLSRNQLISMARPLGQYHAISYAMKLTENALWKKLVNGIVPLPFINKSDPNDAKTNLYRPLYRVAFDRFYEFYDRKYNELFVQDSKSNEKLSKDLENLREKYFTEPTLLLERLRTLAVERPEDEIFAAILHGDFNRNNVLFQYGHSDNADAQDHAKPVQNVKLIDFQELRYSTPVIDLSFFMFINTLEDIRYEVWFDILIEYHTHMLKTLSRVLKTNLAGKMSPENIDKELEKYSFQNFYTHFRRYAIYGALICMHFLPWLLCSEKECALLSNLFETDMHSSEFHKISLEAGGDEVNMRIFEILKLASKFGYLNYL
ncbi:uncharacterized protein LOC119690262 [Teleopsis dalmanni]|uniref:uncharacterized protein LOC119690262 n=1 Tax=Teleopsis dalmanni TaxID=139649 RepID=UPI0018CF2A0F|nr:uncharacterized protein LOC119690262 [Teleopsis dalmanni]